MINGSKMWITNGVQSDWICLLANTSDGDPHRNKSLICVPKETKGVSVAKQIDKIGNFCSDTAQLFFEDVVVPKSYVIGEEGKGFTYQMLQFQEERIWGTVSSKPFNSMFSTFVLRSLSIVLYMILIIHFAVLLALERCIEQTVEYTRERKAFGRSILDNQVVHYRLAELETEVEALRSMAYRTVGKSRR